MTKDEFQDVIALAEGLLVSHCARGVCDALAVSGEEIAIMFCIGWRQSIIDYQKQSNLIGLARSHQQT